MEGERTSYHKARYDRPEVREAIKKANKARRTSPEVKAADALVAKAWRESPEGKAAMEATSKAYHATKEGKESLKVAALKTRCKRAYTTVEHYNSLPKKCSFPDCTIPIPGGKGDWHLDHDHITNKFRGLLCNKHNRQVSDLTLGDVENIRKYLQKHIATIAAGVL